jgi:hypothetical protein
MASDPRVNGSSDSNAIELLPGLARLAATAWWHSAEWAMATSIRTSFRLLEVTMNPSKAGDLVRDARGTAEQLLRELIQLTSLDRAGPAADVAKKVADAMAYEPDEDGDSLNGHHDGVPQSLREEGEQLLKRSRDVHYEEEAHPAYERILSQLAPDEGRILRLLLLEGPQASVDIRTGGPVGMVKSRLVAPGLSMIGARAGCRYVERVPAYLNNLFRLGLIWFSRETLNDQSKYQVLEAQPDVLEAIHSVSHAKVVRRSIHLTPFGEDFCRVCLTPETARLDELPHHSVPPEDKVITQPPAVGSD